MKTPKAVTCEKAYRFVAVIDWPWPEYPGPQTDADVDLYVGQRIDAAGGDRYYWLSCENRPGGNYPRTYRTKAAAEKAAARFFRRHEV